MSFDNLLTSTVSILHRTVTGQDDTGVDEVSFGTTATVPAWAEQTQAQEQLGGRDTVLADWLVIVGPDVVVEPYDRVQLGTLVLEVVGPPEVLELPRGAHHQELHCRWIEGG